MPICPKNRYNKKGQPPPTLVDDDCRNSKSLADFEDQLVVFFIKTFIVELTVNDLTAIT